MKKKPTKPISFALTIAALVFCYAHQASALLLFSSGDPIPAATAPGYPILGRAASGTFLGIDAAAGVSAKFTINDIGWSIENIEVSAFGPSVFGLPSSPQSVHLGIANDTGLGVPSSGLLFDFLLTGVDLESQYTVNTGNLVLMQGSYWLTMLPFSNDPNDFTTVGWNVTATPGLGNAAGSPDYGASWFGNEAKPMPAFSVQGTVVPEPGTMLLLATGLCGLISSRRWRR